MNSDKRTSFKLILFTLFLLLAGTALYMLYIKNASDKVRVFDSSSEEVYLTVENSEGKVWDDTNRYPNHPRGSEYSVNVYNETNRRITDWSVTIDLNGTFEIDSSWNGEFTVQEDKLLFTPDSELGFIDGRSNRYFGAVIYGRHVLEAEDYEIRCKLPVNPITMPFTYVLFALYILWFVYVGAHIIANARIESLLKQRKRDLEIIDQSIKTFTSFVDAKDSYTRNHSVRVATYAMEIGRRKGLDEEELKDLYYGTLLHDVGKIGIPDQILRNKGSLNEEEFMIIKTHPMKGVEMLENFTAIPHISDCAHYHHERFDGKGYPEGLKGEDIPLYARIATIADAYDAMSSDRRYRKSLDRDKIISEFKENAGTQFDPALVPLMIDMINDGFTDKVQNEYAPEDD